MSTSIGNLAVILSANAGRYSSEMKRAGGSTRRFSSQAQSSLARVGGAFRRLSGLAIGLSGIIGAGLGIRSLLSELERLDEVGKTAERLNTTSEALTRLQFAGEQTGVELRTFNMAIQRMNRRISEAAQGSGEALKAITEDLKLDPVALAAMDTAEQFKAVTAAFNENIDAANRTRVAMRLFDSEGVRLINTLGLGAVGLERMAQKADQLGFTAGTKATKGAAALRDSMNELKRAVGGVAAEIISKLTPHLKSALNLLKRTVDQVKNIDAASVKSVVQVAAFAAAFAAGAKAMGTVLSLAPKIIMAMRNTAKAAALLQAVINPAMIAKVVAGLAAGVAAGVAIDKAFDRLQNSVGESEKKSSNLVKTFERLAFQAKFAANETAKLNASIMDAFSGGTPSKSPMEAAFRATQKLVADIQDRIADMKSKAKAIFDATRTPAERLAKKLEEITNLRSQGFITAETARRAIEQARGEIGGPAAGGGGMGDSGFSPDRVNLAAMGATAAVTRKQDNIERNTGLEVKESKKQTATLGELLKLQRNSQGAAITIADF